MTLDYLFLSKTALFNGCTIDDIKEIMNILSYTVKTYEKEQTIFHTGQVISEIGIILSGSIQIENIDILGNKSILGLSHKGEIFGESYACVPKQPLLVDVIALENSEIMLINVPTIFNAVSNYSQSAQLIKNLLRIASKKNLNLSMRIFHSTPKTIRARLYSYFSEQVALQGTNTITIPLDRQQLADYLSVDRTALSKELGKMRNEGLIDFHKNQFLIKRS